MKNYLILIIFILIPLALYSQDFNKELYNAIVQNDINRVKELIEKGIDVNAKFKNNFTALTLASSFGHFEIVKYLIEKGANVNAKQHWGKTALMFCKNPEIVRFLIDNGADINVKDQDEKTALDYAIEFEHEELITIFLKAGAKYGKDIKQKYHCHFEFSMIYEVNKVIY